MQSKLYSFLLYLLFILFTSCSKQLVPEERLTGTWKLAEAERKKPFNTETIITGYENGVFKFNQNSTATYTDVAGMLSGNWIMKRSDNATVNALGKLETESKVMLSIKLYNYPANRLIDWLFDNFDFKDSGKKLLVKMEGAGYEYRYWFVKQ